MAWKELGEGSLRNNLYMIRLRGDMPGRPADMPDELWAFVLRCWDTTPVNRPGASQALDLLKVLANPSTLDETESTGRGRGSKTRWLKCVSGWAQTICHGSRS